MLDTSLDGCQLNLFLEVGTNLPFGQRFQVDQWFESFTSVSAFFVRLHGCQVTAITIWYPSSMEGLGWCLHSLHYKHSTIHRRVRWFGDFHSLGGTPSYHPNFNRIFPHRPSILGYPHSWKPPFLQGMHNGAASSVSEMCGTDRTDRLRRTMVI